MVNTDLLRVFTVKKLIAGSKTYNVPEAGVCFKSAPEGPSTGDTAADSARPIRIYSRNMRKHFFTAPSGSLSGPPHTCRAAVYAYEAVLSTW